MDGEHLVEGGRHGKSERNGGKYVAGKREGEEEEGTTKVEWIVEERVAGFSGFFISNFYYISIYFCFSFWRGRENGARLHGIM